MLFSNRSKVSLIPEAVQAAINFNKGTIKKGIFNEGTFNERSFN
jgi:hypothetical protein